MVISQTLQQNRAHGVKGHSNSHTPWGWGGKLPFYSISSFTSFTPTIPGTKVQSGINSHFPPRN